MKLADFQKYLRALGDAIGAAKGVGKDLHEAADALGPFAHQTMADFAAFLRLAETTYPGGQLPTPPPPPKRKAEKVTPEQLQAAIQSVRQRLEQRVPLTRAGVAEELAKYEALPKPALEAVVKNLGYKTKPRNKKAAVELIADHLLAGTIAEGRAQV